MLDRLREMYAAWPNNATKPTDPEKITLAQAVHEIAQLRGEVKALRTPPQPEPPYRDPRYTTTAKTNFTPVEAADFLEEAQDHDLRLTHNEREAIKTLFALAREDKRLLRNRLSAELAAEGPQDRAQPKMRIYLNRKLRDQATPNKLAAHAVHAALVALGVHPDCKVVVLDAGPTKIEQMTTVIHDAGHTQLAPGTMTAGTNWPEDSED